MRSAEAGGFGLGDCGGVEFAVGRVYDGFAAALVEREVVDFFSGRSVDVALDYWVCAVDFVLFFRWLNRTDTSVNGFA